MKKIIFTVNEQSDGAKIYNGENIRSKKNVDIISITSNNVKIKVSKKIDRFYTLSLLNINEKIVANIKVEDFEKLLIEKDGKRYAFNSDTQELEQVFMTLENNIEHPISNFKRYTPSEQGLQIYRNGESNIGLIDLRNKHSSDFTMKVTNDTMIVSYKGTPYIRHEEWNTGESTRRVIYLFQDKQLLDSNCIVYNICNTNETIHLLNKREGVYNRRLEVNHKCTLSEGQMHRGDLIKKISQYTNQLKDNNYSYEELLNLAYEVKYMVGNDANYSEIKHSLDDLKKIYQILSEI
ncbi:MAG: hypothetical protein KTV77_05525 [Wolbachia endosymbiont of Fragariocoptes setiger]|nr:hypothetical protein [Wolbachia endosymbiont of Fragariocoptes setiger]